MLRTVAKQFYSNVRTFATLEEMNMHLNRYRYAHTLVFFRARWNPQCEKAEQQVNQLAANNRFLQVIKVDSDVSPKIARHYGVKNEPEFVFCLYGDEVTRQIGPNQDGLNEKLQNMVKLGQQSDDQFLDPNEKWSPYGTRFERYYTQVLQPLYDRNVSDL